jgi:type IV pilus assembly protein PilM
MFKFLNLKPETFGLDINDSSFKVIKLRKKRGFLQPVSYNEKDIASGIIKDGIIKDENAFVKNIKDLLAGVKGEKLRTKYVVASLPEEKSFSQVIQMPKMEKEELKSAVVFEAENYIPLPADQMYLDFQVIDPIVDHLDHLDVLIVAIEKTIVDSYVSCFKKSGLIPLAFEVETQAIARALVEGETSLAPLVLIDFGGDSTDFIVFSGNSIRFTCSIPVSSQQITEAISKELGIGPKEAEKVKLKYGVGKEKSDSKSVAVSKIAGSVLEGLAVEVKKYLNFYLDHDFHQHLPQKTAVKKIILSGGGADLKGIDEFLKLKLKIPVEFGNPWVNFPAGSKKFLIPEVQKKSLSFVTALGLALREPDPEING